MAKKIKTKIKDKDRGYKKFIQGMNKMAKKPQVKCGFLVSKDDVYESNNNGNNNNNNGLLTVLDVAIIHEFGSVDGHIPQRSFIRSSYDEGKKDLNKYVDKLRLKLILNKLNVKKILNLIGLVIQKQQKLKILKGIPPPLQQETIDRKGSSKTLIDTGQMLNSIHYEVVKDKANGIKDD
jgi:hypothetical protein